MTRPPHPPHRHVYVIGPLIGLQKVGLAMDPKARLATLQTACPFDLFCTSRLPSRSARRTRLSAGRTGSLRGRVSGPSGWVAKASERLRLDPCW